MPVLTIECFNYKQHKDRKIILDGKSAILMGDIKRGKSNIMKLIMAHTGQAPYPSNPLADDQNEGWTKTTHQAPNGKVYTIQRKFVRNAETKEVELDRMWVYPPAGPRGSLNSMVDDVFGGAFKNGYFDYIEYFYKNKSAVTRGEYFIKAIGGSEVEANVTKIAALKRERGVIGTEKDKKVAIFQAIEYNPDTFLEDQKRFEEERTIADIEPIKAKYLLDNLKEDGELKGAIEKQGALERVLKVYDDQTAEHDAKITELEEQLAIVRRKRELNSNDRAETAKNLLPAKKYSKLVSDLAKVDQHNSEVVIKAIDVYNEAMEDLVKFRNEKEKFMGGLKAFNEYEELDKKWNELDEQIDAKVAENEKMFRKRIPIPELTVGEEDGKPIILYKGKEFSEDNLSTGERLQITTAIQMALNPTGDNFIVVPEAQSLGSEKAAVMAELDKHNIQYLIEMTIPDEEFKVEIIEHTSDGDTK